MGNLAQYLGLADQVTALFVDPSALPDGVDSCVPGTTCDWWPAISTGLRAALNCGDDLAIICDQTAYATDPSPLLDAAQLDLLADWVADNLNSETPPPDLRPLVDATLAITGPDGPRPLLQYMVGSVLALHYAAPDVGPSARVTHDYEPVSGPTAEVVVDPELGVVDDTPLLEAQKRCEGYIGWAIWLDYSKDGFSNDILLRGSANVNEVRLLAGSSRKCAVMSAAVNGSLIMRATSNADSFLASKTKDSGLQSRSGSLRSSDRNQPKLVGAGPYYEWTTDAVEVEWDVWPPVPVFHIFRSPAGNYDMEASAFVDLGGGYLFTQNGTDKLTTNVRCTKQGANTEACTKSDF